MQKVWKRMPQWLRDTLMFILIMGCAVAVCELLSVCYDDNNPFATSVFILAVVLVSRFTTGYWPGILASAVGVVSVNYLFTYPFHEFNLTIDGYPLTFAVMLVVSVLVSTLTTQIKRQEQLRYEAERDRMRANLLRSVSHDIRTPLTAIMGLSATVEESETLTDEGRGMVEEIHQNAQWLLHLSENILSVTRFCDEGVVIEKSDEVVEEIVGSAIRRFRKNCDTDIPITVSKPEEILLAPMDATLMSSWSSVLMRSRCRSGTRSGMAAIMAGPWNAWPMLRTITNIMSRANDTCPSKMATPRPSDTKPTPRSATIMTVLRLCLSAMTPPNGESSPCGR